MIVQKTHLAAVALIAAMGISYFAQKEQNDAALHSAISRDVASCTREVTRDAYEANGFIQLASRVGSRANKGDEESSARYLGIARSVAGTFPAPKGLTDPQKMTAVEYIESPDGTVRFNLTEEARSLIEEGCRQAF